MRWPLDALDRCWPRASPRPYQAERAIRMRLDADRDDEALALAARLYRRFPHGRDRLRLAGRHCQNRRHRWACVRLLAALTPAHRQRLEQSPAFLERRAGLWARWATWRWRGQDYWRALALQPDHAPTRVATGGFWSTSRTCATLRAELAARRQRCASNDPAYAEVLAAGLAAAGRAAPWRWRCCSPMARERSNDFLWLMNYADVLERAGREAPALRVRRHAWLLAQRAAARPEGPPSRVARP
jgi:hypothetical protein